MPQTRLSPQTRVSSVTTDPTELTTRQLIQRIDGLKELFEARLTVLRELIERSKEDITSMPIRMDAKVLHLRDLHNEVFLGIDTRFKLNAEAVRSALEAAEKAVGKSETSTSKQLEQQQDNMTSMIAASETKIDAVRDRLGLIENRVVAMEGKGMGVQDQKGSQNTNNTMIISIVSAMIAAAAVIISVIVMKPV